MNWSNLFYVTAFISGLCLGTDVGEIARIVHRHGLRNLTFGRPWAFPLETAIFAASIYGMVVTA